MFKFTKENQETKTNKIEIVVAAYKEDLDWTEQLKHTVTIYSKNDDPDFITHPDAIPLPNFGRESHTFFHHIFHNYHNLADVTIFAQGNPFDHCPRFVEFANLNSIYDMCIAANKKPNSQFCPLTQNIWPEYDFMLINKDFDYQFRLSGALVVLELAFPKRKPVRTFHCLWGGQFAISRKNLLKFDRGFYYKMIQLHEGLWAMEYIWMHLYDSECQPKFDAHYARHQQPQKRSFQENNP